VKLKVVSILAGAAFLMSGAAANAVLISQGVTYDLQITSGSLNSTTASFNLRISGINGAADTELGRYGVDDFAFSLPNKNFSSATAAGFVTQPGGLDSDGCNGKGNFFCFNGTAPAGPALAAGSVINIPFSITLSSGNFLNWDTHLKIDWEGSFRGNYNNVSQSLNGVSTIDASPVPGPIVGAGLPGLAFAGAGLVAWLRRRRAKPE
jgi:hypothetical protein